MPSRRSKTSRAPSPESEARGHAIKKDDTTRLKSQSAVTNSPLTDPLTLTPSPQTPPLNWPTSFPYLPHPIISPYLPPSHQKWLRTRPQPPDDLPVITLPYSPADVASRVEIRVIEDPGHPAFGQRGLFAARDLLPGELVVGYFGYVHGGTEVERAEWEVQRGSDGVEGLITGPTTANDTSTSCGARTSGSRPGLESSPSSPLPCPSSSHLPSNILDSDPGPEPGSQSKPKSEPEIKTSIAANLLGTWDTSSYDLNMYRTEAIEIAVDASLMGNEARFVNDYRGVPAQAQMRDLEETERDRRGKRRVKGWDVTGSGEGNGDRTDGKDGGAGGSYGHGNDIAMPNAEFRDVWFDVPEHIDLTLPISTSNSDHTLSTHLYPHEGTEINDTTNYTNDLATLLNNLRFTNNASTSTTPSTTTTTKDEKSTSKPPRRKKKIGLRGVAVFVMPAGKAGKRKGGIKKGQEVLVSYGKGFWAHHRGE